MQKKSILKSFSGNSLKALPNGKIGGYLVLFGDPENCDLDGQYFTKSTYFGHNNGNGAECIFNHTRPVDTQGYDKRTASALKSLSTRFMANPLETHIDDIGLWAEIVADMSDEYEKAIYRLAEQGKLKFSAGSAPHLVKTAPDGFIKSFVITEGSLTPWPMEYRMLQHKVKPLKSLKVKKVNKKGKVTARKSHNWIRNLKGSVGSIQMVIDVPELKN